MRDHFFEAKGCVDKKSFLEVWDQMPELVSAKEIANSYKHFILRKRSGEVVSPKTKSVSGSTALAADVYEDE